ncbi:MAG: low-specificity L-threonine aldolase [Chloroflexota bacterium]|nr:low-specificity L-threonine aldolase [Chloroflexota bacterium]
MRVIDLRSDTVTLPTPEMRKAMYEAELGDDVFGEDPTVNRLQEMAAEVTGKEAALLVSSGTQGNLVSILARCHRGDEIIVGSDAHIFLGEVGGAAALAGVQLRLVSNDEHGMMAPQAVREAIRGPNIHNPPTTLLCIENTHNRCSGAVVTPDQIASLAAVVHPQGISIHLDGARVFNAAVYLELPVKELVKDVDDLSFCLSKGLACPVGSLICGTKEFVERARKWRKVVGGGMRQAGIIAACGVVALQTMVQRLAEDHENAHVLAEGLAHVPGVHINPRRVQTNIVIFTVDGSREEFVARLAEGGVKVTTSGDGIRMVTHYGIMRQDVEEALVRAAKVARGQASAGSIASLSHGKGRA